jgi:rubrerythrin
MFNRPEDYPDWDGDESIMYIIDNCIEEDDEEFDNMAICEVCGNMVYVGDNMSFVCPECGISQNI